MKFLAIFVTVFSTLGLAASAESAPVQFAIEMAVEENGQTIAEEKMVVFPGKSYTLDLTSSYKLSLEVAPDTLIAAKRALDRDLGELAAKFVFVDAALTMNVKTPENGEQRKEVIASGMLVPIVFDREIRAAANMLDDSLKASTGDQLDALAFTVKAKPFAE